MKNSKIALNRLKTVAFTEDEAFDKKTCSSTSNVTRTGKATPYVQSMGTSATCWWWLRTPGASEGTAACVRSNGTVFDDGNVVVFSDAAVRPVIWINLK